MAFGQILEMALRALEEALAPDAAGADRDLRLADMIARAQRIAFRVHEDQDALFLIVMQEAEGDRDDRGDGEAGTDEQAQRQAGQKHDGDAARQDHRRSAQIRLYQHQRPGNADQHQRGPDGVPAAYFPYWQHRIEAGDRQHDDRLHEFRRLQLHEAQVDPALTAAGDAADQFHQHQ